MGVNRAKRLEAKNIIEINLNDLDPIEVYIWKHLHEKMEIVNGEEVGFGCGPRNGLLWIRPQSSEQSPKDKEAKG